MLGLCDAIILTRKRELDAFVLLFFKYLVTVNVMWLSLKVMWVGLQFMIVEFIDQTYLHFELYERRALSMAEAKEYPVSDNHGCIADV